MNLSNSQVLTREQEFELTRRYKAGDKSVAEEIIRRNQRFVQKQVSRYHGYGLSDDDLFQEGCMGLARALEKFEPERGLRFISYATHWVNAYIRNYILASWSLVKIGTTQTQRKLFYCLRSIRRRLELDGCPPERIQAEIDREAECSLQEVIDMESRLIRDLSLDAPLGDEGCTSHLDNVETPENSCPDQLEAAEAAYAVREVVDTLNPRDRLIAEKRLLADERLTFAELGELLGVSRERFRQLELKLKAKLRARLARLEAA